MQRSHIILIIQGGINSSLVSGEEVVINNDIKFLKKNGIQVFYEKIKIPNSRWQSVIGKVGGLIWSFSSYKKVKSAIDRHKPDIVHFHTIAPYLSFSAIVAANSAGVPIVQTLHNGRWLCLEGGYFRSNTFCNKCVGSYGWLGVKKGCGHGQLIGLLLFLNNFIVRKFGFLFKYVSRFIAVSEFVRKQHIKSGFPENRVTVRNNGFNALYELDIDDSWLRREGVVYAGRLSIAKGSKVLEYLISNLDCKISIVGNGPELNSLKQFCIDHQFGHVEFFGRLNNKETLDILKKAVVSVVPSQCGDSYPTVALESLSVGTPIVASNLGGLPDIVNASSGGKLADYVNNDAFLGSIKGLLDNRERAKKMGDNGMKYIKENVGANKQGKELIRIYNQVIKDYRLSK
jgi:glycosyltransferase involved in cell wall biosynthesis